MPPPLPLLALRAAALGYGPRPLFSGVDLALAPGDRACLVGRNGSGKSTLLKALAGTVELDRGERFVQPGTRIAALAQEPDLAGFATVADYVAADLGPDEAYRTAAALDAMRLAATRDPSTLSGGEARRAALARVLAADAGVLLLDEPTNHLDLPAIEALEARLSAFRGALLLISHDRAFLDALSRRTYWLDRGALRTAERGFAGFEEWRDQVFAEEAAAEARADKRIAAETLWLREGLSARRRRNQGRVRALSAMREARARRQGRTGTAALDPAEAARSGTLVIEAEHVSKSFGAKSDGVPDGGRVVVRDFSTRILRGDRVGILGPNGAGKTTLLRLLTGEMRPDTGTVRIGANVVPATFDQNRASLPPDATLRGVLVPGGGDMVSVGGAMRHVASYLQDFLFDPSRLDAPVRSLSGGERSRLVLASLFARPSNLLILDEPTNDLDIETLDLLEEVLADYAGTLLLVSHDRDFLDRLVTSVIAVEGGGRVDEYVGGYTDYARQRPPPAVPPAAKAPPARPAARPAAKAAPRRLSYSQQRELDGLPARIDALAAEAARLAAALADPALYARDPAAFTRTADALTAAERDRAAAEERWLALETLAEQLAKA